MESDSRQKTLTFRALQARLLAFVNSRINSGEYTERSLAKALGVSQPQLHNVLKGARRLQPGLADLLLFWFGISVVDLLDVDGGTGAGASHSNPQPNARDFDFHQEEGSKESARLRLLRKDPAHSTLARGSKREAS